MWSFSNIIKIIPLPFNWMTNYCAIVHGRALWNIIHQFYDLLIHFTHCNFCIWMFCFALELLLSLYDIIALQIFAICYEHKQFVSCLADWGKWSTNIHKVIPIPFITICLLNLLQVHGSAIINVSYIFCCIEPYDDKKNIIHSIFPFANYHANF